MLGNGKVDASQLYPARFMGAINASPSLSTRKRCRQIRGRQRHHRRRTACGARSGSPHQFKTERGTNQDHRFGRLGDTKFFAAGDVVQLGAGQPLMVVNAVGDGKRVAFNLDKVLRNEPLQDAHGAD